MRSVEWGVVPQSPYLILLTMADLEDGAPMLMADFQDTHGLAHRRLGLWIGFSSVRGVRLGTGVPEMRNGVWYVEEDQGSAERVKDLPVEAKDLCLRPIPVL